MADSWIPPNLDREHFNRQHRFLLNRVAAHDQAETQQDRHAACAACLERDAAIAALLADQPDSAVRLFVSAGNRLLKLGLFVGLSLSKFGHIGETWDWRAHFVDRGARLEQAIVAYDELESHEPAGDASTPLLEASARLPTQLLHLYYALTAAHDDDSRLYRRVRELLLHLPERTVGPLEIPVGRYIGLLDEISALSRGETRDVPTGRSQLSQRSRDTFRSAILRRGEQLEAAQADRKHWNVLPNPGNLIDLDLMALSVLLIERTGSTSTFDELIESDDPMLNIPLHAPEQLRRQSWRGRHL